jgi:hypothetical protein
MGETYPHPPTNLSRSTLSISFHSLFLRQNSLAILSSCCILKKWTSGSQFLKRQWSAHSFVKWIFTVTCFVCKLSHLCRYTISYKSVLFKTHLTKLQLVVHSLPPSSDTYFMLIEQQVCVCSSTKAGHKSPHPTDISITCSLIGLYICC